MCTMKHMNECDQFMNRALMNIMYSNKNQKLKFYEIVSYISQNSIRHILVVIEKDILSVSNSTLKIKNPFFLSNSSWKAKIKTKTRNDVMDCMILQFLHKMVFQIINCAGHKSILHNSVILTFFWYEFLCISIQIYTKKTFYLMSIGK